MTGLILSLFIQFCSGMVLWPSLPVVQVQGYPIDSIATKVNTYRYENGGGIDMLTTMNCENGEYDTTAVSSTHDHGLCQLNYRYNKQRIDDPQRGSGWEYQARICLEKWLAVEDKNLRSCYKIRNRFLDRIILPQ